MSRVSRAAPTRREFLLFGAAIAGLAVIRPHLARAETSMTEPSVNEISPVVQALIDRLACLNPARPRFDQATIERSLSAFLAALDLENRPILWVDDGMSAYRLMAARSREVSPALGKKLQVRTDAWGTVAPTGGHVIAFEAKAAAQQVAPPAVRGLVHDLARAEVRDLSLAV